MPYTYKKIGNEYVVYKKDSGKRVGTTAGNKESLRKYLSALHSNVDENSGKILRMSIRNLLLKEVIIDQHAEQRLAERLLSPEGYEVGFEYAHAQYTSVGKYFIPKNIVESILNKIDVLKTKPFPRNKDYGVKLDMVPINVNEISFYEGYNQNSIKGKNLVLIPGGDESNGSIYYAIIRGNVMRTFMLMKNYIKIDAQKLRVDFVVSNWDTVIQNKVR